MVRTKADAGSAKVSAAKAPRKITSGAGSGASPCRSGSSKDRYAGGNSYNPQPTPNWQKGISTFFKPQMSSSNSSEENNEENSTSKVIDASEPQCSSSSSRSITPIESESKDGEKLENNGMISDDE